MDPLIRSLVRYQEHCLEVARLDARLGEIPAALRAVDADQEAAAASIAAAKARAAQAQKSRRDHERELQDLEQKKSKYDDQSREVKTNEQYRAIMNEIAGVKARIDQVEEKILLSMEEFDECERLVREEEKALQARRGEFDARRAALTEERERLGAERGRAAAERDALAGEIPAESMDTYSRVAKLRGNLVMARAREERCTGCNVRLRPQVFSDVRKNSQIIQCESCKRILYYVEEAPPPGDAEGPVQPSEASNGGAEPPAAPA